MAARQEQFRAIYVVTALASLFPNLVAEPQSPATHTGQSKFAGHQSWPDIGSQATFPRVEGDFHEAVARERRRASSASGPLTTISRSAGR